MEMHDLIIVGGGPAGLTAGIYAARAKLDVLLLDKQLPGGQLNTTTEVENYPGFVEPIQGPELMERMRKQAERFGVRIKMEEVTGADFTQDPRAIITDGGSYRAPVVILSMGATPVPLPAKNADKLIGRGVSYCATCDGYFFREKNLIVVGAGDAGLTEALFLTKFAREVRISVRHPQDDPHALRARDGVLKERALNHPQIRFLWNTRVIELLGEQRLEGVVLEDLGSGERIVQDDVSGVFVSIGHRPATEFLRGKLPMDERGYLLTDAHTRTEVPGVFAVGDVRQFSGSYAQAVIAAADGCIAALEAEAFLESGKWEYKGIRYKV